MIEAKDVSCTFARNPFSKEGFMAVPQFQSNSLMVNGMPSLVSQGQVRQHSPE